MTDSTGSIPSFHVPLGRHPPPPLSALTATMALRAVQTCLSGPVLGWLRRTPKPTDRGQDEFSGDMVELKLDWKNLEEKMKCLNAAFDAVHGMLKAWAEFLQCAATLSTALATVLRLEKSNGESALDTCVTEVTEALQKRGDQQHGSVRRLLIIVQKYFY